MNTNLNRITYQNRKFLVDNMIDGELLDQADTVPVAQTYQTLAKRLREMRVQGTFDASVSNITLPLLPTQQTLINAFSPPDHCNLCKLLVTEKKFSLEDLTRSVDTVIRRYDVMHTAFTIIENRYFQYRVGFVASEMAYAIKLRNVSEGYEYENHITSLTIALQKSFDLLKGPLFRAFMIEIEGIKRKWLLFIAHHTITDVLSFQRFVRDILAAIDTPSKQPSGETPLLESARKPQYSFFDWAAGLVHYDKHEDVQQEIKRYWGTILGRTVSNFPKTAHSQATPAFGATSRRLNASFTGLLDRFEQQTGFTRYEIIYAAAARAQMNVTGCGNVIIQITGSSRLGKVGRAFGLQRVGTLSQNFPLIFLLDPKGDELTLLSEVKRQLSQVPNHGLGYSHLKMADRGAYQPLLRQLGRFSWLFNILPNKISSQDRGFHTLTKNYHQFGRTDRVDPEDQGIYCTFYFLNGRTLLAVSYNESYHDSEFIETTLTSFLDAIKDIFTALKARE